MTLLIRPMQHGDAAACARILAEGTQGLPDGAIAPAMSFDAATRNEIVLVAIDADAAETVLGLAGLWLPGRFVHHLYVDAGQRGRGVGAGLLRASVAACGGTASLKCNADNARALAFYAREGWRETGETGGEGLSRWTRLAPVVPPAMRLVHAPLADGHVRLEPLTARHRELLRAAAGDLALFRWWPRDMGDWDAAFDWQLGEQAAGRWLLHAVIDPEGRAVGQTCYLAPAPEHARVEIGGTWYAASAQGTRINPAAKRLMLAHAFACGADRVELKTDALNERSRAAMLKMGATFEGVHRHHMRRPDGTARDTAWYSVLAEEWPAVRAGLEARLAAA